ncbi:MAG: propanediol utilization protein [Boseongicola sp. SB0662_bin_57]|nr:propanediol utilization protein [Boseongicola sp. SB0662_bin_57]
MEARVRPAHRVTGHFGEWLQGRLGSEGPVVLVTLPCETLGASISLAQANGRRSDLLSLLSPSVAGAFLQALDVEPPRANIEVIADARPGAGAGMSTAMLLALARAMGIGASPEALANACLEAEGAVDPLMMDRPETLLWASREARAVRSMPQPPAFSVVGGFLGPPIQTVPDDSRFADVSDLVPNWIAAAETGDRAGLARIATVSAERTTALRGPADDCTATLAQDLEALGWCRAHTGSARGLLFEPGCVPVGAEDRLRAEGYVDVLRFATKGAE